tara:strand:+ start:126 stop:395 length:270 start_codon:yes stop_codon:yes gene_type:complete
LLNTFHKISKLIITFSAVIGGWTSIILLSNTTFNLEIKDVIYKMYINQKNFIYNVKDLSILLLKDANQRFSEKNIDKFYNIKNDSNNLE